MGYTTEFNGSFKLNKPLDEDTYNFLVKLNETRRMARNVGPEFGIEGEFYVDGKGDFGQDHEPNIISFNAPPSTQPSLWCQWIPSKDRSSIRWDGGEKFYSYTEWIEYIIAKILAPKGYSLNGQVSWQGEDDNDQGTIVILDNKVKLARFV